MAGVPVDFKRPPEISFCVLPLRTVTGGTRRCNSNIPLLATRTARLRQVWHTNRKEARERSSCRITVTRGLAASLLAWETKCSARGQKVELPSIDPAWDRRGSVSRNAFFVYETILSRVSQPRTSIFVLICMPTRLAFAWQADEVVTLTKVLPILEGGLSGLGRLLQFATESLPVTARHPARGTAPSPSSGVTIGAGLPYW